MLLYIIPFLLPGAIVPSCLLNQVFFAGNVLGEQQRHCAPALIRMNFTVKWWMQAPVNIPLSGSSELAKSKHAMGFSREIFVCDVGNFLFLYFLLHPGLHFPKLFSVGIEAPGSYCSILVLLIRGITCSAGRWYSLNLLPPGIGGRLLLHTSVRGKISPVCTSLGSFPLRDDHIKFP